MSTTLPASVGHYTLTHLRVERGLSRAQLARTCGLSEQTLYRAEHGQIPRRPATRATIARALGVSVLEAFPIEER